MPSYWAEPAQRLFHLVTEGPLILTDDGYGMWCYHCESVVPIVIAEVSHEAIIEAAYQYGDHNRACMGQRADLSAPAEAGPGSTRPPQPGTGSEPESE